MRRHGLDDPDTQAAELGIILVELRGAPASKILQRMGSLPATQSIMVEAIKGYVFARLHRQAGRVPEAKQAYEDLLASFRSKIPKGHPLLALCLGDMAQFYKQIGEMDRAMTLAEEAADIARRTIPTHPLSQELLSALAAEYSAAGEHRKAIALYEELDGYLGRLNSPAEEGFRKAVRERLEECRSRVDSGE